jgi:inner membrane protein
MPTAFTHIFTASALGTMYAVDKMPTRFWILCVVCSILPDIDIIGYYFFKISYGGMFGHRGFFHSLLFAALTGLLVVVLAFPAVVRFTKKWWALFAFFFLVTASHGFLDSMTDKGMGVGFFMPFDDTRYFMPWRPIYAAPMKVARFFSQAGLDVLVAEILWIWLPIIALSGGVVVYRRTKKSSPSA